MPWIAAGIAAGGIIGGGLGAVGNITAAGIQANAAQYAANLQYQMYQQTAARLQPWTSTGQAVLPQLGGLLGLPGYQASGAGGLGTGALTTPFQMTNAQLAATPGFSFTLNQGEQAVQNQASALGQGPGQGPLGPLASGPEMKGEIQYAGGLASTTEAQDFSQYWTNLNNIYSMLSGTTAMGANAGALTGQAGTATAQAAGNALQTGAAAQAAGTSAAFNALGGGVQQASALGANYATINALIGANAANNPASTGALMNTMYSNAGMPNIGTSAA